MRFVPRSVRIGILAFAALASCATRAPLEEPLDWTLGTWSGFRHDGADGTSARMTLRVEKLGAGEGYVECLRVEGPQGPYVGLAVRTRDAESDRWWTIYANSPGRPFARLRADATPGSTAPIAWLSTTASPDRRSKLVWERFAPDHWRRTQLVSEDDGATWRPLFIDDLERDPGDRGAE